MVYNTLSYVPRRIRKALDGGQNELYKFQIMEEEEVSNEELKKKYREYPETLDLKSNEKQKRKLEETIIKIDSSFNFSKLKTIKVRIENLKDAETIGEEIQKTINVLKEANPDTPITIEVTV